MSDLNIIHLRIYLPGVCQDENAQTVQTCCEGFFFPCRYVRRGSSGPGQPADLFHMFPEQSFSCCFCQLMNPLLLPFPFTPSPQPPLFVSLHLQSWPNCDEKKKIDALQTRLTHLSVHIPWLWKKHPVLAFRQSPVNSLLSICKSVTKLLSYESFKNIIWRFWCAFVFVFLCFVCFYLCFFYFFLCL